MDRLLELARRGRLAVFEGADLSAPAPSVLPTWWDVQAAVLEGLASAARNAG